MALPIPSEKPNVRFINTLLNDDDCYFNKQKHQNKPPGH